MEAEKKRLLFIYNTLEYIFIRNLMYIGGTQSRCARDSDLNVLLTLVYMFDAGLTMFYVLEKSRDFHDKNFLMC